MLRYMMEDIILFTAAAITAQLKKQIVDYKIRVTLYFNH